MSGVTSTAKDELINELVTLDPESAGFRNVTQAVKVLTDADLNDRRLDFDIEKEETRKLEKSNELIAHQADVELRKIDMIIHALDVVLNPGQAIARTILNNKNKKDRDVMGYTFEKEGFIVGSHTLNNAQKDHYD